MGKYEKFTKSTECTPFSFTLKCFAYTCARAYTAILVVGVDRFDFLVRVAGAT